MEGVLYNIKNKIDCSSQDKLKMYFVTRKEKSNLKSKRGVLDKYEFQVLSVDINDDIRNYMFEIVKTQLNYSIQQKNEYSEYDVINDDHEQIFTYSQLNKIGSFQKIIFDLQNTPSEIVIMQNFSALLKSGSLWAYCIEIQYYEDDLPKKMFTFRKINSGAVVVDEKENDNGLIKSFMTIFSTQSNKLEFLCGNTIKLDKQIDCIYWENCFYILHKRQFETMTCLSEEYKEKALIVVDEIEKTGKFQGIEHFKSAIEKNTAIHKKLIRLNNLANYCNVNKSMINKMNKIAKRENYTLKTKNEQIIIENEKDVNMVIKLLCDYYKEGIVSGKQYGTYSGKEI